MKDRTQSFSGDTDTIDLPVIDISNPDQKIADELVAAATSYGFVFIKCTDLNITPEHVTKTFDKARSFFASPLEEKKMVAMQHDNKGWTSYGEEVLDPGTQKEGDPKEAFNFGDFEKGSATQPLTPSLQAEEAHFDDFFSRCRSLCMQILDLFALGLKIDPEQGGAKWFSSRHDHTQGRTGTILRLLYYPPTNHSSPSTSSPIRAGAHSDYGSLTLLFRLPNQPGLEILTPSGTWAPVPVSPPSTASDPMPPVLVNIGDLLSYWTGGLLKSTVHRVVGPGPGPGPGDRKQNKHTGDREAAERSTGERETPGRSTMQGTAKKEDASESGAAEERYSIAFFCHPVNDTRLVSVPSDVVRAQVERVGEVGNAAFGAGAAEGRALTAAEHLHGRLAATYGWETQGSKEGEMTAA